MSGRSAQTKGRRAEIELARYLQEAGFADARPGDPLNYGRQADVSGVSGLHIECKRHERLEMAKWYAKEFADYLEANADNNDIFEYPKSKRLVVGDGQRFYDS